MQEGANQTFVLDGTSTVERVGVIVIHGVGDTETGWINEAIIEPLAADRAIAPAPHSEIHSLSDVGSDSEGARFNTLVRRAEHGDRKIIFAEFVWADLSRLGRGPMTLVLEALKVAMEAPDVLAQAFLRNRMSGIHWLIGFFILAASRLLKWFVIGLNAAIVASALWIAGAFRWTVWFGWPPIPTRETLLLWLLIPVGVFLFGGGWLFYRRQNRDIGLSDFGAGCALSAIVILVYMALDYGNGIPVALQGILPDGRYYNNGRMIVFGFWMLWCISTLMAMLLLVLVWMGRLLGWRPDRPVPLVAAWVGMFNILMQAILVKLVVTPLSIMACIQLEAARPRGDTYTDMFPIAFCDHEQSTGVLFFTLFETVFLVAALLWIVGRRWLQARYSKPKAVPRLIIHPLLIATAAVTVGMHIAVFAAEMSKFAANLPQAAGVIPWWLSASYASLPGGVQNGLREIGSHWQKGYQVLPEQISQLLVFLVPVYLGVLNFALNSSSAVIHIARDLVDHQYRARRSFARVVQRLRTQTLGVPQARLPLHPRRARIANRLETIMKQVIAEERLDKLILLTHSQGSVIAFDFLRSKDLCAELSEVGEIHVVTLGSPLTHIYGHYFDEYQLAIDVSELRGNVGSWINMWRIDDPIGNEVKVVAGNLIINRVLPKGGHVHYWREKEVRQLIVDRIYAPVTRRYTPAIETAAAPA